MKIIISLIASVAIMATVLLANAQALEQVIELTPINITVELDKNGNQYARLTAKIEDKIGNETFTVKRLFIAFGDAYECLRYTEEGMPFRAVVQRREYKERISYVIISVIGCDGLMLE